MFGYEDMDNLKSLYVKFKGTQFLKSKTLTTVLVI